ncbi:MAG: helix-turn-helix domain-containing protein [Planctomycetaceae bacterium]
MRTRRTSAIEILNRRIQGDEELRQMVDEEYLNAAIAQMIYDARTRAGLTQSELARRAGTRQPVIARVEDADYRGHSLALLRRIATALNLSLTVQLKPRRRMKARTRRPAPLLRR